MQKIVGTLRKMTATLADPVDYQLPIGDQSIALNALLEKYITLEYQNAIYCIQCGRKTSKSFQQGYCFPCYRELLNCNLCMIHPQRCPFKGECPEGKWVSASHGKPHIIYLANTSGLKVGVTRETQIPTRWIDQGAIQALPLLMLPNRYEAGLVEVALKEHVNDKTNWRAMLKGEIKAIDLCKARDTLVQLKFNADKVTVFEDDESIQIRYPVLAFPKKIKPFNFDSSPLVSGKLLGIKGQYLILDTGVINIRKFGGYEIMFSFRK